MVDDGALGILRAVVDDTIETAHRRAVAAGDDSYVDPATGFDVFTAAYLAERGSCCDTGCRHCPYGDDPADETRSPGR